MVDGIVDIPLPGRPLESDGEEPGTLAPCHFLVGPENRLVEVAVHTVLADAPLDASPEVHDYNPIVLYGPSGTGKSHIAQGVAAIWKTRHRRQRVVSTTAVDFARELADAIDSQSVDEFRTKYRTADLLVFEDLGQLITRTSGKLNAQEEFVHTLDALVANQQWVIVTASAAPVDLAGLLPALQSRLSAGLMIPLALPGVEARLAVLQQLAALRHVELPEPAAKALAEGINGTVPELAGALMQLAMPNGYEADPIDLRAARHYVAQRNNKTQPSLHDIARATAKHFALRLTDLRSPVRRRALVTARGVAVYLARHCAGESLEEIGRYFGGRDHTTVMHSCRRTEEMLDRDPTVHDAIERLRKELWKN